MLHRENELDTTVKDSDSRPQYPSGVPDRFDPDGNVQPYPGNTIISSLSPSSDLYASMLVLHDKLRNSNLSHLYALLPPSSWHMTIFDGVLDKVRRPGYWSSDLSMNASLAECDALFAKKLSSFDLQCDTPYLMSVVGYTQSGFAVHVQPRTPEENTRLRGLRDRLSEVLKIRHSDHEVYGFHLGLAYFLRYLTDEQKKELSVLLEGHLKSMPTEFELGAPEFCKFEDMYAYHRQFYLE